MQYHIPTEWFVAIQNCTYSESLTVSHILFHSVQLLLQLDDNEKFIIPSCGSEPIRFH